MPPAPRREQGVRADLPQIAGLQLVHAAPIA
jgi:hypothetical protein